MTFSPPSDLTLLPASPVEASSSLGGLPALSTAPGALRVDAQK
jgi:hypothetical protein